MPTYASIRKIFAGYLEGKPVSADAGPLEQAIYSSLETNHGVWKLEDLTRLREKDFEYVAHTKKEINATNQKRVQIMQAMDTLVQDELHNDPATSKGMFYAESPGMIIDRLTIMELKRFEIDNIIGLLKEPDLVAEYEHKKSILLRQMDDLGNFLDDYLLRVREGKVYFKIQEQIKLYNDERVREAIKKHRDSQ